MYEAKWLWETWASFWRLVVYIYHSHLTFTIWGKGGDSHSLSSFPWKILGLMCMKWKRRVYYEEDILDQGYDEEFLGVTSHWDFLTNLTGVLEGIWVNERIV